MPFARRLALLLLLAAAAGAAPPFNVVEATVDDIQKAVAAKRLTYRQLVQAYLDRIERYDRSGPKINSVRHVNPQALQIAAERDRNRRKPHGPLYGIPILLKDNINTADEPTTAGSLALEGYTPPYDAFLVKRLRAAGAIILGKANLTEWANYLTAGMPSGYSSIAGYVLNPYDPRPAPGGDGRPVMTPGGSSAGPGAAMAANFATLSIGTETSGSILSPCTSNSIVGIRPTVGLISRHGIVPIAASQDSAGPMTRTVRDAAILLGVIAGPDPADAATVASAGRSYSDYTQFLKADALKGARLGLPRAGFFATLSNEEKTLMEDTVAQLRRLGAEVIEADIPTVAALRAFRSAVLKYEFKRDLNAYFATLGPSAPVKSLADMVAFNAAHQERALKYGQTLAIASNGVDLEAEEAAYLADRAKELRLAKAEGLDVVFAKYRLDAVIFPAGSGAAIGAKAGYPSVIVPAGYLPSNGMPVGLTFTGPPFSEPKLLGLAYSFEQGAHRRKPPKSTP
jgi:amidase